LRYASGLFYVYRFSLPLSTTVLSILANFDILNSLEHVQSFGVNLICIEEGIDSSQTSGNLLISVLSAVAKIEHKNIIEQTMNGRKEKARQGGWNGGFAP
jgi:site-specific DNA recombinase